LIYYENLHLKDLEEKNQPLSIPQKQILLYRGKLIDEKRKLSLYDDLMKISKIFQEYQSNIFEKFREWEYKQPDLRCSRVSKSLRLTSARRNVIKGYSSPINHVWFALIHLCICF
jgi:hypothetical protein